jgi:hypothetical protein
MSRRIATREAVDRAVKQLLADGKTISIRRVQSVIGHGSHLAIAAHLREIEQSDFLARSRPALLLTCLRARTAAWEQAMEDLERERRHVARWETWWHALPEHLRSHAPRPPKPIYHRRNCRKPCTTKPDIEEAIVIASDRPRRETHFTQDDAARLPPVDSDDA